MQCPKQITPQVIEFSQSICSNSNPEYVTCSPLKGRPSLECFDVVDSYVAENGGKSELGWSIYIWPEVMIEAELHAVWVDKSGERRDIAPHQIPMPKILFLSDESVNLGEFYQVNNHRKALSSDPLIQKYIEAANIIFEEENRGEFAKKNHFVQTPRWKKFREEKNNCEMALMKKYGPPIEFSDIANLIKTFFR